MVSAPFSPGLRLTVAVGPQGPRADEAVGTWRDRLTDVATRELSSRRLASDVRPTAERALEVLGETFATHPMVNVGRRLDTGVAAGPRPRTAGNAFVIAQVVLLPDVAPIPPGGEFPDVSDEEVGEPVLVHVTPWGRAAGSEDEQLAADLVLEQVVSNLPRGLWRHEG
jgi:hypothetical protein